MFSICTHIASSIRLSLYLALFLILTFFCLSCSKKTENTKSHLRGILSYVFSCSILIDSIVFAIMFQWVSRFFPKSHFFSSIIHFNHLYSFYCLLFFVLDICIEFCFSIRFVSFLLFSVDFLFDFIFLNSFEPISVLISVWFKGFTYLNIRVVIWTCCWMLCLLTTIYSYRSMVSGDDHTKVINTIKWNRSNNINTTACTFQLKKTAANKHLSLNSITVSVSQPVSQSI